jgi:pimeloyl-ACP methyl ester carboxylesterase
MAITKKLLATTLIVGGTLGSLALINKVTEQMAGELDTVLNGEERRYPWKYGDIFYKVKGAHGAKPLVLIHGFGPGASSYEWRKNIDALSAQFRVFALDLLGFGLSEHPAMDYDAELYTDLLSDFITEVVGTSAIAVAHGATSAYVITAAYRRPQLFERLVLISPPPAILEEAYPGIFDAVVKRLLSLPIVGQFIYNLLTSRQAIRRFYDKQGYHNPGLVTDELVEYVYTTAHQPGTRFATAALLGKYLHLNVHEPLARLQMPVVAVWGRESASIEAGYKSVGAGLAPAQASAAFTRVNKQVEVHVLDKSSQHLQDEQARQLNSLLGEFAGIAIKS